MELRVLEYFLAVAREQSISGAAEYLHLTQPTLSRQLRELEEELGCTLLVRGKRGQRTALTPEGRLFRQRAQEILEAMGYRKGVQESVSEKVQETVRDTSVSLVTALANSLLETVVHTVLFLLSFAVLTLVLRLVVKMLDLMARLPGIHMLNSLGGAAVGLAESVLILFLLFWVLDRFGVRIAQSTIDETYLLRFFVTEGPLGFLSVL